MLWKTIKRRAVAMNIDAKLIYHGLARTTTIQFSRNGRTVLMMRCPAGARGWLVDDVERAFADMGGAT